MSPPMTTVCGLSRLTATDSTSPTYRPLSRSRFRARGVALESERHEVAHVPGLDSLPVSRATSAQPPAIVSRQPVAPHRQS